MGVHQCNGRSRSEAPERHPRARRISRWRRSSRARPTARLRARAAYCRRELARALPASGSSMAWRASNSKACSGVSPGPSVTPTRLLISAGSCGCRASGTRRTRRGPSGCGSCTKCASPVHACRYPEDLPSSERWAGAERARHEHKRTRLAARAAEPLDDASLEALRADIPTPLTSRATTATSRAKTSPSPR